MSSLLLPPARRSAGRFAAAIALTIGFYLLALVLSIGLLALAILRGPTAPAEHLDLVAALCLGGSILVAIVPRRTPSTLRAEDHEATSRGCWR